MATAKHIRIDMRISEAIGRESMKLHILAGDLLTASVSNNDNEMSVLIADIDAIRDELVRLDNRKTLAWRIYCAMWDASVDQWGY